MAFINRTIIQRLVRLVKKTSGDSLRARLTRGGFGTLAISISNVVLGLLLSVVLARNLGPKGYGIYAYAFTLISILSIPAQFGLPRLVVRETAKAQASEQWGLMRGLWRWASTVTTLISLGGVCLALGALFITANRFTEVQSETFLWGILLLPFLVLGLLCSATLEGLRHVILGRLPQAVIRPAVLILLILLAVIWDKQTLLNPATAMALNVFTACLTFLVSIWLLYKRRPQPLADQPIPLYQTQFWLAALVPLALTAGMQQINKYTDIVMLGFFLPAEDVGIYRVAVQGAMLVIFGLQTIAMFISPYFAQIHTMENQELLQKLVKTSARVSFFTALPIVIILALWGEAIIKTVFGQDYVPAYTPLLILSFGQLINALFGPIGILLNMTGHERDTLRGVSIAAGVNVLLNFALIPRLGMNGAAIASSLTFVIWNIVLWNYGKKRLGLSSLPI